MLTLFTSLPPIHTVVYHSYALTNLTPTPYFTPTTRPLLYSGDKRSHRREADPRAVQRQQAYSYTARLARYLLYNILHIYALYAF